jgi:hypothetical protein
MFGLVVAMTVLVAPVSSPAMADKVASSVGDDVLETDLVGLWYWAFVSPEGTIEKCNVLAVLGDDRAAKKAAEKVCDEIVGERVKPAIGLYGRPSYGSFIGAISLAENVERMPAETLPPDLTIRTNGGSDGRVSVNVAIGADGKVLACEPSGGSDQLSRRACDEVSRLDFAVEKAKDGQAVGYLRPLMVKFEQERG